MNKKRGKWISSLILLMLGVFSTGIIVFADHDDDDDRERKYYEKYDKERENYDDYYDHEKRNEYRNHEDDEDYYEEEWKGNGESHNTSKPKGYWNFWMRKTVNYQNVELPIDSAEDVLIKVGSTEHKIYAIPQDGQLLVPGEQLAKVLSAKATYYSKSKILVVSKNDSELIVRAGSNAAYENSQKTPMPTEAQYIEKSLYLPISVLANSMGYRVSWDETTKALILEKL